jgi:hypothetical protein
MNILNDISAVYLQQVAESAVPGKPAERLGAVTAIPKSEQEAARERLLAKAKAKREKMKEEIEIEEASYSAKAARAGKDIGKPGKQFAKIAKSAGERYGSKERGEKVAGAVLAKLRKEEIEIDEAVKGADPEMRKAASAERRSGDKKLSPSKGKEYATHQKQQIAYMDKITKKNKNVVGLVTKEALDPVGHEDKDIDNDGDHDKTDKYLLNRRKVRGAAIAKKKMKESFSNWRQDLSEVMDDVEAKKEIKEKKVNNKITINPDFKESVENMGGELLEMVEVDEAVYGGQKEEPKDTRYTVTAADKKGNTAAYQKYKAGDKKYKAAPHLEEKTLTSGETKKKEEIVKSMKKKAGDFEKRYPGRGKEVMYATATKMAKKVAEEYLDEREHDEPGEGSRQRYGDYRGLDRSGKGTRMSAGLQPSEMFKKNKKEVKESMDDQMEPSDDKKVQQQKQKIQMQKVRELTTRIQAARKGVY